MARSRRGKSASISSATDVSPALNGIMGPPSPPAPASPVRASPATRRKTPTISKSKAPAPVGPHSLLHSDGKPSSTAGTTIASYATVLALSLVTEALTQTATSFYGRGDLASISKRSDNWPEIVGLLVWKALMLAIYWFGGYDGVDVASLAILLNSPTAILYYFFYQIDIITIVLTVGSSLVANALPFYLLRPISGAHDPAHTKSRTIRNRTIIIDPVTTIATSAIATLILAASLQIGFSAFLRVWLITRFVGLRSLAFAYIETNTLPLLILWLLPAGIASTQFLFKPSEGVLSTGPKVLTHQFDPVTASLGQHFYHNAWGWYTARQKTLIGRTTILGALVLTETAIQVYSSIRGVEFEGALGYAAVWAIGVSMIGAVLEWVGQPSD